MPSGEIERQVLTTEKLLEDLGYNKELHFRPPYGNKFILLPKYLAERDIKTIMWDIEPETQGDGNSSTKKRAAFILRKATPGSIVLMHVMTSDRRSFDALPAVIENLSKRGFRFVTISEMLTYE
jgi:peptidoglycan/xylan/chitin deacetylase (PgdA/CDA1 family)